VESTPGAGSAFFVNVFVLRGEKSAASAAEGDETNKADADGAAFAGKRMLVADDIELNREILIALLEDTGIVVDCAENGRQALDMVAGDPETYDIVFMDLQMPEMGGMEATRRIRALPARARGRLPIFAMTASVFQDDVDECIKAGMDGHLGKPLDIDKVMEVLKKYLK